MADKYLVTCQCGIELPVGIHQAGSSLVCTCGEEVQVPPLRKLRELPGHVESDESEARNWSPRHAVASGGVLLAVFMLAISAWKWFTMPEIPEFDPARHAEYVEVMLEKAPPVKFWQDWVLSEPGLRERGFSEVVVANRAAFEAVRAAHRLQATIFATAASFFATVAAVAWIAWPRAA